MTPDNFLLINITFCRKILVNVAIAQSCLRTSFQQIPSKLNYYCETGVCGESEIDLDCFKY